MTLFRWKPVAQTLVPLGAGLGVIALSAAMKFFAEDNWARIFLRDVGMICGAGIAFPLWYIWRSGRDFAGFGLTLKNWYIFLPVNLVLGAALLGVMIRWVPPDGFRPDAEALAKITVILCAGVFEIIFFYGFQRTLFEQAFGTVPAVILTALFYSAHHIGFQPEFLPLFGVGVMYAAVYRAGNSALLIYPFFWGVGAAYNVLLQSGKVSPMMYAGVRAVYLPVLIALILILFRAAVSRGRR